MSGRSKTPTKRGSGAQTPPTTDEIPTEILGPDFHEKRGKKKTAKQAPVVKAISMKTPGMPKRELPEAEMPHVKLRALSEISRAQIPLNLGNLAPPYDPHEARKRSFREYAIWGCVALILASAIALVVWFVAR
jgi:hypothetical protein